MTVVLIDAEKELAPQQQEKKKKKKHTYAKATCKAEIEEEDTDCAHCVQAECWPPVLFVRSSFDAGT